MRYGFLIWFCLNCVLTNAATIYVSPKGSDRSSGRDSRQPMHSINKAIGAARAGDTVLLLEGTYREIIRIDGKKGAAEKPLLIRGQNKRVWIDGGAPAPAMDLAYNWIELQNTSWVVFEQIAFLDGWTDPVRINQSSYISFRQCRFSGGRKVILATGANTHHVLVEDCYWNQGGDYLWTLDKDIRGVDAWLSMHHELLGFYNGTLIDSRASGGSFVIRRNRIENAYNGIRFTSKKGYDANIEVYENDISNIRDNDFEPEHYAFNLHIYHNRSHNIHKTLSIDDVAGGYIYYYGNTVTMDSSAWAKKICSGFSKIYGGIDSLQYPLYFFNNSFFGYGKGFNAMEHTARMLKHYNNAYYFAGESGWVLNYIDPTNSFDHDVCNKPWPINITQHHLEANGLVADPMFRDVRKRDLRLKSGSPAIDAGRVMQFPEFAYTQRFLGKAPDAGAFEGEERLEGPAFRFRKPEQAAFDYVETPRIVRYTIAGSRLRIFFSDAIDRSTLSSEETIVRSHNKNVPVKKITLSSDGYECLIDADEELSRDVAIRFKKMPASLNGGICTYWASAIPVIQNL